jgi:G3E family GTPase
VEFADVILLNKVDLMPHTKGKSSVTRLRQSLQQLNPRAKVLECDHCNVPLTAVLNTGAFDMAQVGVSGV